MFYIIGTPLGNSEDISIRALKTLSKVDVILAEDTRSFQSFYKRMISEQNITSNEHQRVLSYHDQNEFKQAPYVLKMLEKGQNIALVSESGMPLISDPGSLLIREVIKRGYEYTSIPGPTAFTTAAVLSGFDISKLLFIGFLPKKEGEKVKLLQKLAVVSKSLGNVTVAFYESPHRIGQTFALLDQHMPESKVAICRELTKKFEEVATGKPRELMNKSYKGEITVILSL